ncbi:MAG: hypothetical protein Q9209_002193 [Squamulea sp. 1 TL-2023]
MGITQLPSAAHRAFQTRSAGSHIFTSGGRRRVHCRRLHSIAVRWRSAGHLRALAAEVNKCMPRQPSLAFRSQDVRRKVWMLEAKKRSLRPARARKLSSVILKLQRKVKYINRQQHRSDFRDALRRTFEVRDEAQLAQWSNYITQHQQTARAAGLKWATECYTKNDWAGQPKPSSQALNEVLLHLVKVPGYEYSTWSRGRLCFEAQNLLHIYDNIPPEAGSKEYRKARIRMIRDMMSQSSLEREQAKGLSVSSGELAEAQHALFGPDDQRWSMLPLEMTPWFYKEKNFQWTGIRSWVGLEVHKLPLRASAIANAHLLPRITQAIATKGKHQGNEPEKSTNSTKCEWYKIVDESTEDIQMGLDNGSEAKESDGCGQSTNGERKLNDYQRFGSPFPSPDDYPWALGS